MTSVLLSSAYFAPVQYYQKLYRYDQSLIERYDHFIKQTYRNRCVVATASGTQTLSIPTEHYDGDKCLMRDIRISDHGNWRHLHWNAIESAYGNSPYFEFYADDIRPFFERHWDFLYDFNMDIMVKMCELLDIHPSIIPTDDYVKELPQDDFRDAIRPKNPIADDAFQSAEYYQIYKQRYGFIPNLSILDLLFNMGNESIFYL
jgi:hypothetical protein